MGLFRDFFQLKDAPVNDARARVRVKWPFDVYDDLTGAYTTVTGSLGNLIMLGQAGAQAYDFIYSTQSAVYTVVEFLATQVAGIGLKVYRRNDATDREEIRSGQLFDLLHEPAPGLTYSAWMHQWVADRCVFGNAYMQKTGSGASRSLVPLPAGLVTPKGGNLISAARYEFRPTDSAPPSVIDAGQMLHSRRYNPRDPRIGVSPLEPLRVVLRSDAAALAHMEGVWANGTRTGGWLRIPDELSPEALERVKESVKAQYSGSRNAGRTGILEGGAKFERDAWSPAEAEFIAGRKLTLETVARAYNVPLPVLALTDTATYASQESFHTQLYVDTLGPWFRTIEEDIEASIFPWLGVSDDIYVEFNVEEKLRGSFSQQAQSLTSLVKAGVISVNEVRAYYNLPRVDDPEFDVPKPAGNQGGAAEPDERDDLRVVPLMGPQAAVGS